jgi:hypothetical protein
MGWTVRGSNPGGGKIFRTCLNRPWGPPRLLYNRYRVFLGGTERQGLDADLSPPSSAVVMKQLPCIPLLPLWVLRPVQSLSACTGAHFNFFYYLKWPWILTPKIFCFNFILDTGQRTKSKIKRIPMSAGFSLLACLQMQQKGTLT